MVVPQSRVKFATGFSVSSGCSITVVCRVRPARHNPEPGYSVMAARVLREDLVPVQIWVPRKNKAMAGGDSED